MKFSNSYQEKLHSYIEQISKFYENSINFEVIMYRKLLEEGQFFEQHKHRPSQYPLKLIKNCFQNAYQMLNYSELEYAEGIAYSGVIPAHHAWNIDKDGKVVDTTWRTHGKYAKYITGREYFGIIIPRKKLDKVLLETKTYGYWK